MSIYDEIIWNPREIEQESMRQVKALLAGTHFTPGEGAVVSRLVHTSGDPDLAGQVRFHQRAVAAGREALRRGAHIYTDVTMLTAGINGNRLAQLGGEIHCAVHQPEVAQEAKERGITRSAVAMEKFGNRLRDQVVAIGNAPTALFTLLQMMDQGLKPALVVGMPVGFVGAARSKELLLEREVPYITLLGTRGGSPLAAATINALLYME
ncbi:precorrin-8X methylmutase [Desulforamulus ruminis]|uniref:Precorrin-8X methylmutase n=1 Tax=Desulforamulus ruminis (strain ATCC 23193 / DSM 2154 / NCIMB 8452 / DL) TaxID=696281 RepID=F6DJW9_DESRL|nr:precorrin-8X methylmutase [Desulforamulus ruminis]AEG59183.1 Precorrin-8X methylmutase [Desulforamulus ruminis DSM 2154]